MKKDRVFFGPNGLTNTSADYIANLAKEMIRLEENDLSDMHFVDLVQGQVGSTWKQVMQRGWDEEQCATIIAKLEHSYKVKCLIAWLREAIKAKDKLGDEVDNAAEEEVAKKLGLEELKPVEAPKTYTMDDHLATLSLGEREKIYSLQTKAATIGKMIHDNGPLAQARQELHKAKTAPAVDQFDRYQNKKLIMYEPTVKERVVDEIYFELQQRYRVIQAELNGHLHKAKVAVENENHRRRVEYRKALSEYGLAARHRRVAVEEWRAQEKRRVQNLRIVIPEDLEETYREVANN